VTHVVSTAGEIIIASKRIRHWRNTGRSRLAAMQSRESTEDFCGDGKGKAAEHGNG
jgi:hypothetical protein